MELKVMGLSVVFRKKQALENVSFSAIPGIYGVVGENGAGKTTLFRSLLGVQKHGGTVEMDGIKNIGYVPQKFDCLHGLAANIFSICDWYGLEWLKAAAWYIGIGAVAELINIHICRHKYKSIEKHVR